MRFATVFGFQFSSATKEGVPKVTRSASRPRASYHASTEEINIMPKMIA